MTTDDQAQNTNAAQDASLLDSMRSIRGVGESRTGVDAGGNPSQASTTDGPTTGTSPAAPDTETEEA